MFIASKLLAFATQPIAWVLTLLFLGLICLRQQPKLGARLCWAALLVLAALGWQPLPDTLLRHLEGQSPSIDQTDNLQAYAGVVVLGGALEPAHVWHANGVERKPGLGQIALNDAGERMVAAASLAKQHPQLVMLFTGGEGELAAQSLTEADRARIFFNSMGVPTEQMRYESESHTTYENAIFSAKVAGVDIQKPWLLLTSASHMPRSLATFRKAGWNVTAYPVDFQTSDQIQWTRYFFVRSAERWHLALHEIVGLWAYRLAGRA